MIGKTYVISPSAFFKIREIVEKISKLNAEVYVSTLGISYALKEKYDIDYALDKGVKVRAFSHKPSRINDLPIYESEAILLAKELNAILIVGDKKVEDEAKKEEIEVVDIFNFLNS